MASEKFVQEKEQDVIIYRYRLDHLILFINAHYFYYPWGGAFDYFAYVVPGTTPPQNPPGTALPQNPPGSTLPVNPPGSTPPANPPGRPP